jgi:single-strand DNA-binding protein
MPSVNRVTIIGNASDCPELRTMPSGDPVCNFSLATSEKYKDKKTNEVKESVEWHRIAVFGSAAKYAAERMDKGSLVYVEGKLRTRKFTDSSGKVGHSIEIVAEQVKIIHTPIKGAIEATELSDAVI